MVCCREPSLSHCWLPCDLLPCPAPAGRTATSISPRQALTHFHAAHSLWSGLTWLGRAAHTPALITRTKREGLKTARSKPLQTYFLHLGFKSATSRLTLRLSLKTQHTLLYPTLCLDMWHFMWFVMYFSCMPNWQQMCNRGVRMIVLLSFSSQTPLPLTDWRPQ